MPTHALTRNPATISALLGCAAVLCAPTPASAETIYKSIDAQGNVTYSSAPADGAVSAETLAVSEEPTEQEQAQARAVNNEIEQQAKELSRDVDAKRAARGDSRGAAELRLEEAKAELERVSVVNDDDWQNLAQGGRHLKQSYLERVRNAEAAVQEAEEALARVRRDGG
jgi:hypothetical protein